MHPFFNKHFSFWKRFLIEIPFIFLAFELFEQFLNSKELSFAYLSPHPYLAVVIGLALIYGLPSGIFSGIIASLLIVNFKEVPHMSSYMMVLELFTPFFMIIGGASVGAFSSLQKANLFELNTKANELAGSLTELDKDRERLTKTNLILEKKVVTREDTILTLYEAAQNLGSLDVQEILSAIPNLLTSYMNAEKCSVYVLQDNQLTLNVQHNWNSDEEYPRTYPKDHALFKKLTAPFYMLSQSDLEGIDDSLLIAPLVTPEKELYGIVKIEKITFLNLTPSSIKMLEILSIWIMNAIVNASSYDKSKQSQVRDEQTGAYSFFFFKERLLREIRLALRYELNLTVILVRIEMFETMTESIKGKVLSIISRVMEFKFREDDIIARGEGGEFQFAVLQPFTDREQADASLTRCLREILSYEFKPFEDEDIPLLMLWEILDIKEESFLSHAFIRGIVGDSMDQIVPYDKTSKKEG